MSVGFNGTIQPGIKCAAYETKHKQLFLFICYRDRQQLMRVGGIYDETTIAGRSFTLLVRLQISKSVPARLVQSSCRSRRT